MNILTGKFSAPVGDRHLIPPGNGLKQAFVACSPLIDHRYTRGTVTSLSDGWLCKKVSENGGQARVSTFPLRGDTRASPPFSLTFLRGNERLPKTVTGEEQGACPQAG